MQRTLDISIKKHEIKTTDGAYVMPDGRCYAAYMGVHEWQTFASEMQSAYPVAYAEYGAGSGGEMKANKCFPPKMASYGSSSRLMYLLGRNVEGFHFEYKLPTSLGGIAHLDGYLETDSSHVFVETKCREPYGAKQGLIPKAFRALYEYIDKDTASNLHIQIKNEEGGKMEVEFSAGELTIERFDIKQMICHLLGIATRVLKQPTDKRLSFLYLVYNPRLIEIVDIERQTELLATYDRMRAECDAIDFGALFACIGRYLRKVMGIGAATALQMDRMVAGFTFTPCDQSNFLTVLKQN